MRLQRTLKVQWPLGNFSCMDWVVPALTSARVQSTSSTGLGLSLEDTEGIVHQELEVSVLSENLCTCELGSIEKIPGLTSHDTQRRCLSFRDDEPALSASPSSAIPLSVAIRINPCASASFAA